MSTYYKGNLRARLEGLQAGASTGERSELRDREAIAPPLPGQPRLSP